MVEVKTDIKEIAVSARKPTEKQLAARWKPGQTGNPHGMPTRNKQAASLWNEMTNIFKHQLDLEVQVSGTTMPKKVRLVCAIIDGAIALNPACLKAVVQIVFPKSTHITNIDNRQVNIVGGLLDRLAKVEAVQLSSASALPEPIDVKGDVTSNE